MVFEHIIIINHLSFGYVQLPQLGYYFRSYLFLFPSYLRRIYTVSVFRSFLLLHEKVCAFSSAFLYVHIRTNQTVTYWTKVFRKKNFCKGVQLYFKISLLSFIYKIFEQNFYPYVTVYLVRIWTYKNADEKAQAFSRRSKNAKKRILCKFTFTFKLLNAEYSNFEQL